MLIMDFLVLIIYTIHLYYVEKRKSTTASDHPCNLILLLAEPFTRTHLIPLILPFIALPYPS